ncbi:hypothetical protein [Streptomyces sp. NPDC004976]
MPENTVTTPLAQMEPEDVADAFDYIRALQARDIDTACTHQRHGPGAAPAAPGRRRAHLHPGHRRGRL